jgi:hypothetical protein
VAPVGPEPVHDIVLIENATMAARTVIQWSDDRGAGRSVDLLALRAAL